MRMTLSGIKGNTVVANILYCLYTKQSATSYQQCSIQTVQTFWSIETSSPHYFELKLMERFLMVEGNT